MALMICMRGTSNLSTQMLSVAAHTRHRICNVQAVQVGDVVTSALEAPLPAAALTVRCVFLQPFDLSSRGSSITGHEDTNDVHQQLVCEIAAQSVPCKVTAINAVVDRRSRRELVVTPQNVRAHDMAVLQIAAAEPLAAEPAAACVLLGRVCLRRGGDVVAVGTVEHVELA